jgi:hypothetical protein
VTDSAALWRGRGPHRKAGSVAGGQLHRQEWQDCTRLKALLANPCYMTCYPQGQCLVCCVGGGWALWNPR